MVPLGRAVAAVHPQVAQAAMGVLHPVEAAVEQASIQFPIQARAARAVTALSEYTCGRRMI
jgi:hypothetical protein